MARVKGPNGLVFEFSESVAAGLLLSGDYSRVEDEQEKPTPTKKAAAKPKSSE